MPACLTWKTAAPYSLCLRPILGNGRSAKLGWHMQDYNPQGAAGHALAATAAQGQALLQDASAQLVLLLQEISAIGLDEVLA